jgi:hypothetical protein
LKEDLELELLIVVKDVKICTTIITLTWVTGLGSTKKPGILDSIDSKLTTVEYFWITTKTINGRKKEEIIGLNTISKYGEEDLEPFNVELIDLQMELFSDIMDPFVGTC